MPGTKPWERISNSSNSSTNKGGPIVTRIWIVVSNQMTTYLGKQLDWNRFKSLLVSSCSLPIPWFVRNNWDCKWLKSLPHWPLKFNIHSCGTTPTVFFGLVLIQLIRTSSTQIFSWNKASGTLRFPSSSLITLTTATSVMTVLVDRSKSYLGVLREVNTPREFRDLLVLLKFLLLDSKNKKKFKCQGRLDLPNKIQQF